MYDKLFVRLKAGVIAVITLMIGILCMIMLGQLLMKGVIPIDDPFARIITVALFGLATGLSTIGAYLAVVDYYRPKPPRLSEAQQAQAGFRMATLVFGLPTTSNQKRE